MVDQILDFTDYSSSHRTCGLPGCVAWSVFSTKPPTFMQENHNMICLVKFFRKWFPEPTDHFFSNKSDTFSVLWFWLHCNLRVWHLCWFYPQKRGRDKSPDVIINDIFFNFTLDYTLGWDCVCAIYTQCVYKLFRPHIFILMFIEFLLCPVNRLWAGMTQYAFVKCLWCKMMYLCSFCGYFLHLNRLTA